MAINTYRYWTISIITNPLDKDYRLTKGYRNKQLKIAKDFFENEFGELIKSSHQNNQNNQNNQYINAYLWKIFHDSTTDIHKRALAGLCLRCYISHAIVKSCHLIANKNSDYSQIFVNSLPYVLNDDGNSLIFVDWDNNNQLILKDNGHTQLIPKEGKFFSVEILRTYNFNLSDNKKSESLDNWCIRLTRQNKDLQTFLLECGVWVPSDWSLLCGEIPQSLDTHFTNNQLHFIEVFHRVYRRDRRKSRQRGKCCEPTQLQLKEMRSLLQSKDIVLSSTDELIQHFKDITEILRQDMYCTKTGSPKADSIDVGTSPEDKDDCFSKPNIPDTKSWNCEEIEEIELRKLLSELPDLVLFRAISKIIPQRIAFLAKKKNYSIYAPKFIEGIKLYYQIENPLSLREIAALWEINWSKARRIFKFRELIENTQSSSEKIFMNKIKEKASNFFVNEISCDPNNLKQIAAEVRDFLHEIAFKEAYAEITASKSIYKKSLFAKVLRYYINH